MHVSCMLICVDLNKGPEVSQRTVCPCGVWVSPFHPRDMPVEGESWIVGRMQCSPQRVVSSRAYVRVRVPGLGEQEKGMYLF